MGKASQRKTPGGNNNPTGKGGFAERPADRNVKKPGPGRGHRKKVQFGSDVLADMTTAYTQPADRDDSPAVKAARKLLASNYEKFMVLYAKAKGEAAQETVVAATVATHEDETPASPKEQKIEDMVERLLREFESEEAKRD